MATDVVGFWIYYLVIYFLSHLFFGILSFGLSILVTFFVDLLVIILCFIDGCISVSSIYFLNFKWCYTTLYVIQSLKTTYSCFPYWRALCRCYSTFCLSVGLKLITRADCFYFQQSVVLYIYLRTYHFQCSSLIHANLDFHLESSSFSLKKCL